MVFFKLRNEKRALLLCMCAALIVSVAGCGVRHDDNTTPAYSDPSTNTEAEEHTVSESPDYTAYVSSDKITMWESFDLSNYTPFAENNELKTLDEPATMRFTVGDTLPKLDGTWDLYPAYAAIAQATYPDYLNEGVHKGSIMNFVKCIGTPWAYQRLADRECDMIFVPGPDEEQEAYAREKGVELVYTPVCREAFVFFVHPDNPIDELSQHEIRGIYSGNITRWSQLDVPGLKIILAYQRNKDHASQMAMEQLVMQGTPLMTPPVDLGPYDWDYVDVLGLVTNYQNRPGAIGYSLRFYCNAPINKDIHVKILAVDGVEPTAENIENGAYPLIVTFYAVTRSDANKSTRALLDWICSEQGQDLIEKAGYIRIQ